MQPLEVTLMLFEGCDLLDVGGPYEVLLTANRIAEGDDAEPPFRVRTVSVDGEAVRAYGGMGLIPDGPARPSAGVFLVPGAIDLDPVIADTEFMEAVRGCGHAADLLVSVCTGSLILAAAGLLEGVQATTHHEDMGLLAERLGEAQVHRDVRWVDAGAVVTAGGLSSGIAMALHLVARTVGVTAAHEVATKLEYDWRPDAGITAAAG